MELATAVSMDQELDDAFGRFVFATNTNKHLTRALPFLRGETTTIRSSLTMAVKREQMAEEKERKEGKEGKEGKESKDEKDGKESKLDKDTPASIKTETKTETKTVTGTETKDDKAPGSAGPAPSTSPCVTVALSLFVCEHDHVTLGLRLRDLDASKLTMQHFTGGSLASDTHPHANQYSLLLYVLERVYKRPRDPKHPPHTAKTTITELLDGVVRSTLDRVVPDVLRFARLAAEHPLVSAQSKNSNNTQTNKQTDR